MPKRSRKAKIKIRTRSETTLRSRLGLERRLFLKAKRVHKEQSKVRKSRWMA